MQLESQCKTKCACEVTHCFDTVIRFHLIIDKFPFSPQRFYINQNEGRNRQFKIYKHTLACLLLLSVLLNPFNLKRHLNQNAYTQHFN